jgi:hypothetical protein
VGTLFRGARNQTAVQIVATVIAKKMHTAAAIVADLLRRALGN